MSITTRTDRVNIGGMLLKRNIGIVRQIDELGRVVIPMEV